MGPDSRDSLTDAPVDLTRIHAITATDRVSEALKTTVPAIHGAARDARVFQIPTQAVNQEMPPTSPVTAFTADDGVIQGAAALRAMDYRKNQHAMATVRCPGVIQVEYDMGEAIAAVNAAKRELRAAMSAFGRSGWTLWRGRIPAWQRLNRLQAYREWHWLNTPVRKIGFSWAGHTHSVEQLRITELKSRLSRQEQTNGHPHIEAELARLEGFDPDEVVVIRKPIAPTPIANVVFADGRRRLIKTALPLVISGEMPVITPLSDFDATKKGRTREDQAVESLLVPYWHAWRYKSSYRFRLPADPVPARLAKDSTRLTVQVGKRPVAAVNTRPAGALATIVTAAQDARGPVPGAPTLDIDDTIRIVAANRAHVYLVSSGNNVWRVPIGDLVSLGQ